MWPFQHNFWSGWYINFCPRMEADSDGKCKSWWSDVLMDGVSRRRIAPTVLLTLMSRPTIVSHLASNKESMLTFICLFLYVLVPNKEGINSSSRGEGTQPQRSSCLYMICHSSRALLHNSAGNILIVTDYCKVVARCSNSTVGRRLHDRSTGCATLIAARL